MATARVRPQVRQERVDAVDDAAEVDPEKPPPVAERQVGDPPLRADPGVVHYDVGTPEVGDHRRGERADAVRVRDVNADSGGADRRGRGVQGLPLDVGDHDRGMLRDQLLRDAPADPGRSAGDNRHRAGYLCHVRTP